MMDTADEDVDAPCDEKASNASVSSSVASLQREKLISRALKEHHSRPTPSIASANLKKKFHNSKSLKDFYKKRKERQRRSAQQQETTQENKEEDKEEDKENESPSQQTVASGPAKEPESLLGIDGIKPTTGDALHVIPPSPSCVSKSRHFGTAVEPEKKGGQEAVSASQKNPSAAEKPSLHLAKHELDQTKEVSQGEDSQKNVAVELSQKESPTNANPKSENKEQPVLKPPPPTPPPKVLTQERTTHFIIPEIAPHQNNGVTYIQPLDNSANVQKEMPAPKPKKKKKSDRITVNVTSTRKPDQSSFLSAASSLKSERRDARRFRGRPQEDSYYENSFGMDSTIISESSDDDEDDDDDDASRATWSEFDPNVFLCGFCTPMDGSRSSGAKRTTQTYRNLMESSTFTADNAMRGVAYLSQQSSALHQTISQSWTNGSFESYLDFVEKSLNSRQKYEKYRPRNKGSRSKTNHCSGNRVRQSRNDRVHDSSHLEVDTTDDTELDTAADSTFNGLDDSLETEETRPVNNTSTHVGSSFELPKEELIELMRGRVSDIVTQNQEDQTDFEDSNDKKVVD